MADDEAIFVGVWAEKWSKVVAPQQFATQGSVRRLNVGALLGRTMPAGAEAGGKLIEGIFVDLHAVLKDGATFWSSGPGMISVFYPKMLSQAADLTHSVLASTIERRVREMVLVPARANAAGAATQAQTAASTERRVSWEDFQRVVRRAKARPEQIQTIDVSELILGKSDPAAHLSKRAWRMVDGVVEGFLGAGGYYARQTGNQILLFFPGLSVSLARMKRNAIAADIEAATGAIPAAEATSAGDDEPESDQPAKARHKQEEGESAEEIARLNQAFAALGDASATIAPVETPAGVIFNRVPVWRAGNQTLVGYNLSALNGGGAGHIAVDLIDLSCLVRAQTDCEDGVAAQSPYLVIAKLHWYTLERPGTRTRYLEVASKLSEAARRYLVLSLCDVPEDLLTARIEDRLRELRPYCRTFSFRTDLDRRDFDQLKGLDLHAIGAELDTGSATEAEQMLAMNGFMNAAVPLKTRALLDGLSTKSMVVAAIAAGFDYLSGTAITDGPDTAHGVRAFSIADLYTETTPPDSAEAETGEKIGE